MFLVERQYEELTQIFLYLHIDIFINNYVTYTMHSGKKRMSTTGSIFLKFDQSFILWLQLWKTKTGFTEVMT